MLDALTPARRARRMPARARPTRFACDARAGSRTRRSRRKPRTSANRIPRQAVSDLTSLTLAEARDGLSRRNFSAAELADAHLAAIEKARALNAYVLETPERAARDGEGRRRAHRRGRGRAARRHSARHQGHVLHRRRAHHRVLAHPRQFRADLRVDRDRAICGATARCCSARPTTTSSPWARRTRPRISAR